MLVCKDRKKALRCTNYTNVVLAHCDRLQLSSSSSIDPSYLIYIFNRFKKQNYS